MNYLVNTNTMAGVEKLIIDLGGSPKHILARFNVPRGIEQQDNRFIPFRQATALLEYCAEELACPDFGIRLAKLQSLATLGPIAVVARNAKTVESAFRAIAKFFHLITPAVELKLTIDSAKNALRITIVIVEPGALAARQMLELLMGIGQSVTQLLAGSKEHALAMHFPHVRLAPQEIYKRAFHCKVYFEQPYCAVDIPLSIMQRAITGADEETARVASEYLASQYSRAPLDLADQVSYLIRQLLPTGHCNIRLIAEQVHLHPRTLQRHLEAQGKIFEQLVDNERRALASHYLSEPQLRLSQIAGLLGYADQSALNRSCRRWFNASPKQIRSLGLDAKKVGDDRK